MNKISKHVPRVINILFVFLLFGSIFFEYTEQMFIYHLWIIWIFCNTFLSAIMVLKDWKLFSTGKRVLNIILIAWWFIGLWISYQLSVCWERGYSNKFTICYNKCINNFFPNFKQLGK